MRIALFGATGAIGGGVLRLALERGLEVRALCRAPESVAPRDDRLAVLAGDARDAEAVARTVRGADAVVSCLGPRANTPQAADEIVDAARTILDAMSAAGVSRLVVISGGAVDAPGDHKGVQGRLASALVRRLARWIVSAKQREFDLVRSSGLDWTAVRPPRVTTGAGTGRYRVGLERLPGSRIATVDVARFMLDALDDPELIAKAPFVSA